MADELFYTCIFNERNTPWDRDVQVGSAADGRVFSEECEPIDWE